MNIQPLIDIQLDRGTATNQIAVWNDTSKRYVPTLNPSGPADGIFGHWSRDNATTTITTAVSGDDLTLTGNLTLPDGGTISAVGALGEDLITLNGTLGEATVDGDLTSPGFIDFNYFQVDNDIDAASLGTVPSKFAMFVMNATARDIDDDFAALRGNVFVINSTTADTDISGLNYEIKIQGTEPVSKASGCAVTAGFTSFVADAGELCGYCVEGIGLGVGARSPNTVTDVYNYKAVDPTNDANAILTNLFAFYDPGMTLGTNSWGFYGLSAKNLMSGALRIGDTTAPTYALEVAGVVKSESGRIPKTHLLTANTTLDETYHEVFCDTDSAGFTITLPAVPVGEKYRIINTGSNTLTIDPNGNNIVGDSIDVLLNSCDILIITWQATKGWW